jgi:hypothetical protein
MPLNVTLTHPREVGRVAVLKLPAYAFNVVVKIATKDPGATGEPAPFVTA